MTNWFVLQERLFLYVPKLRIGEKSLFLFIVVRILEFHEIDRASTSDDVITKRSSTY